MKFLTFALGHNPGVVNRCSFKIRDDLFRLLNVPVRNQPSKDAQRILGPTEVCVLPGTLRQPRHGGKEHDDEDELKDQRHPPTYASPDEREAISDPITQAKSGNV